MAHPVVCHSHNDMSILGEDSFLCVFSLTFWSIRIEQVVAISASILHFTQNTIWISSIFGQQPKQLFVLKYVRLKHCIQCSSIAALEL